MYARWKLLRRIRINKGSLFVACRAVKSFPRVQNLKVWSRDLTCSSRHRASKANSRLVSVYHEIQQGQALLWNQFVDTIFSFIRNSLSHTIEETPPESQLPGALRALLATMPGFDFSNHTRNAALHARGVPLPKATSTGTTIVGCIFEGGVVVRRTSTSSGYALLALSSFIVVWNQKLMLLLRLLQIPEQPAGP
jgi:hypothetical protein